MPEVHEVRTEVEPYDYRRDGTEVHVRGHESHAWEGVPEYLVLYREKNLHESGGSREHPRNRHGHRRVVWELYLIQQEAQRMRRELLREGKHAIVERVAGRDESDRIRERLRDAEIRDREGR